MKLGFLSRPFRVPTPHFSLSTWGCGWARTPGHEGVGFSVGPCAPSTGLCPGYGAKDVRVPPCPRGPKTTPSDGDEAPEKVRASQEAGGRAGSLGGAPREGVGVTLEQGPKR